MKKYFNYIFISLICFMFASQVSAEVSLNCKYTNEIVNSYEIKFEKKVEVNFVFNNDDVNISKLVITNKPKNVKDCKKKISENVAPGHSKKENEKYYDEYCSTYDEDYSTKQINVDFLISKNDGCPENIEVDLKSNVVTLKVFKRSENSTTNYSLTNSKITNSDKYSCGNITGIPKKIPELTSWAMSMIQVAVPIILVILGSIDLFKGITAQKEDEIKKGQQAFIKRLIVAILIFFIVVIIKFFVSILANGNDFNFIDCIDCFLSNDCN